MKSALALTLQTLLFTAVLTAADAPAPPQAAPFYALPAVGAWAEFQCTSRGPDGKETVGTLLLRRTADVEIKGQPCASVEVKFTADRKAPDRWKLRRLAVSGERFRRTGDLTKSVVEAHQQSGGEDAARPMDDAPLASFLRMGFARTMPLEKQGGVEELTTPAGKWQCQQLKGSGTEGDRREQYAVWLCPDTPFGFCQFTVTVEQAKPLSKSSFNATLVRVGTAPAAPQKLR